MTKRALSTSVSQADCVNGVTEGAGSYNQHAKIQSDGATFALRILEETASKINLEP